MDHPHNDHENVAGSAHGWKLELLALAGFCVSGIIFVISGLQSGDALTVAGSGVWIASCLCWMLPYKRHFKG